MRVKVTDLRSGSSVEHQNVTVTHKGSYVIVTPNGNEWNNMVFHKDTFEVSELDG